MRQEGGEQDDLHRATFQGCKFKERRSVVLQLVLLLVLVLDFPLLALEVEYRSPLRMVERGRAVEGAQDKCGEDNACHSLEAQPPSNGTDWSGYVIAWKKSQFFGLSNFLQYL